jgi:hypothetical protein
MKTFSILLLVLLASNLAAQIPPASTPKPAYTKLQQDEAVAAAQSKKSAQKPCIDLVATAASEEDTAAFNRILIALNVNLQILLYKSYDSTLKKYGGAMSFRCPAENHEVYATDENWTIYDPDLFHGDAARDFVFAHEIAHHMNGDPRSGTPPSKSLELRADYNGAKYLIRMGWNKARLLYALDLLELPQDPQVGYPTPEERKAIIETTVVQDPPAPPTLLSVRVTPPPPYEELLDELLNLKYGGPIRLQSFGTNKYVCAIGTPDPKIPSSKHFAFFDNCDLNPSGLFDIHLSLGDISGYWILQQADPCPDYAGICQYAMESASDQLQFWNQNLAADAYVWEKELGEQELFTFEAADRSEGLVRIKAHRGDYITVDPKTSKLQNGGSLTKAAEFKVVFDTD